MFFIKAFRKGGGWETLGGDGRNANAATRAQGAANVARTAQVRRIS